MFLGRCLPLVYVCVVKLGEVHLCLGRAKLSTISVTSLCLGRAKLTLVWCGSYGKPKNWPVAVV